MTMKRLWCVAITLLLISSFSVFPAYAVDLEQLAAILDGAILLAQDEDNTFLGRINSNKYDSESIFNEYGTYGNSYSSKSIWNTYAKFGSEYSAYSPFNKSTSKPPMIIKDKKIIGYLSTNKAISNSISPNLLKVVILGE